jgi:hypothetical protein
MWGTMRIGRLWPDDEKETTMKQTWRATTTAALCGTALALALSSPAHAQGTMPGALGWEVSGLLGRDFDSHESLWAVAVGRRFDYGWKGVLEFADGKHGNDGSYVTSAKAFKEIARDGAWAVSIGAGGAYVKEEHDNGFGLLIAAEFTYAINVRWGVKVESSYLHGFGDVDNVRAPVLQAGVVYKF